MPGLLGRISPGAVATGNSSLDLQSLFDSHLRHEASYTFCQVDQTPRITVGLVDIGLNNRMSGTYRCPSSQITVAYYGEFHAGTYASAGSGIATAQQLVAAYQEAGAALFESLNGSFVLYLNDPSASVSYLVNDHSGSRPLFYSLVNSEIFFAPELKCFATLCEKSFSLDQVALVNFLVNGHLLNDETYYEDVKTLPAGTLIEIKNGGVRIVPYLAFNSDNAWFGDHSNSAQDLGQQAYVTRLADLLMQSVESRIHSLDTTVLPVSGGFDSRGILACIREVTDKPIQTVSWGIHEDDPTADAYIGRQVANKLGSVHHFFRRHQTNFEQNARELIYRTDGLNDDPMFHSSELSTIREIRDQLGCEYLVRGDECFGYGDSAHDDNEALARIGVHHLDQFQVFRRCIDPAVYPTLAALSKQSIDQVKAETNLSNYTDRKDYFYFTQRLYHYLNRCSYYKMTVVELQNPWLDRRIIDFMRTVPAKYRYNKYLYKQTLAHMFPDIYEIPIADKLSLEHWPTTLKQDESLRELLTDSAKKPGRFVAKNFQPAELSSLVTTTLMAETAAGSLVSQAGDGIGLRRRFSAGVRLFLKRFPFLYRWLRTQIAKVVTTNHLPPYVLSLRLLQLKFWQDDF